MTEEFQKGLTELRDLGHKRRSAVMCAEALWWRCHRRIIADYLICAGESVFHILGSNRVNRRCSHQAPFGGQMGALIIPR